MLDQPQRDDASDNVTLEDEIQLKTRAREKGLLVTGRTAVRR
ncbi:hypothetical protein ACVXHA_01205 [Escherichia coli]